MKKTNLKEKLQNWKLGNYFRELSIVTAGVFITLAGTDFINSASQEKQINKSMQMIKMELEENLKSINQAEAACMDKNSPHWAGYTERPYLKKHSFRIKVRTRLFFIGCEL